MAALEVRTEVNILEAIAISVLDIREKIRITDINCMPCVRREFFQSYSKMVTCEYNT